MFIEVTPNGRLLFKALRVLFQTMLVLVPFGLVVLLLVNAVQCTANLAKKIGSSLVSAPASHESPTYHVQVVAPREPPVTIPPPGFQSRPAEDPTPVFVNPAPAPAPVYVEAPPTVYTEQYVERRDERTFGSRPPTTARPRPQAPPQRPPSGPGRPWLQQSQAARQHR